MPVRKKRKQPAWPEKLRANSLASCRKHKGRSKERPFVDASAVWKLLHLVTRKEVPNLKGGGVFRV